MKIAKKLLLKIIEEEVANVLSESDVPTMDLGTLRGTVSFYEKLFPDWGVAEEARRLANFPVRGPNFGHQAPPGIAKKGKYYNMPHPDIRGISLQSVHEGSINEHIRQLLHKEARTKWNMLSPRSPRLTQASFLKPWVNHLRKVIPNGASLDRQTMHSLIKKIDKLLSHGTQVPNPAYKNLAHRRELGRQPLYTSYKDQMITYQRTIVTADPGVTAKSSLVKQLWNIFDKGIPVGGLTLAKPLPGEGELSIVDQKEKVKVAIDDAGKPESPGMKPTKTGSTPWLHRLAKGFSKLGGPLLSIAGIGALWNECEGDLECLAINMMTLGPIKVTKPEDLEFEPGSDRFSDVIRKSKRNTGGVSDSW